MTRTSTTTMKTSTKTRTMTTTAIWTTMRTKSMTRRITTSDVVLEDKARALRAALASCESLLIAFSGGADSAYLAWEATSVLGPSALCVTADSPSYPDHHRQLALRIAREFGLRHEIIHTAAL